MSNISEIQESDEIVRAKWKIDGAVTLADAALLARAFADELDTMHNQGWRLRRPVKDDYGFVYRAEPQETSATDADGTQLNRTTE
jgi:hypothetical protein